jgi:hypothetical protein
VRTAIAGRIPERTAKKIDERGGGKREYEASLYLTEYPLLI